MDLLRSSVESMLASILSHSFMECLDVNSETVEIKGKIFRVHCAVGSQR